MALKQKIKYSQSVKTTEDKDESLKHNPFHLSKEKICLNFLNTFSDIVLEKTAIHIFLMGIICMTFLQLIFYFFISILNIE